MKRSRTLTLISCACLGLAAGCQFLPGGGPSWRPFGGPQLTSYQTPGKRVEEVRTIAAQADGTNSPGQQGAVADLVKRLPNEPDPLVREEVLVSLAKFNVPLARQAVLAGLSDDDHYVRNKCCQLAAEAKDPQAVTALARVAAEDSEFDVRVAAVNALGGFNTPAAQRALIPVLEDRDPAMQFAGVKAMRLQTGRDLGGDVSAYLALAKQSVDGAAPAGAAPGGAPPVATEPPTAVASKPWWRPF
ncbi:hypothetical protein Mal64_29880 [Pseudobythopirellula maris]|uniref:HEAT repeat protein n=1 Tax=Pseudobythopirellula maris TaxID=2527991 RepID=A0A5C5ZJB8_9BACT|nr:HEAT repeat domain-containing protein [Pseudobythopirellula maris]TWT87449.1 hypothetical protein Mal64_29880 [Pseudobythopirellula maris]